MTHQPAITIATILAAVQAVLALVIAFGVDVTEDQTVAILGVVSTAGALVAGFLIRSKVTPAP